MPVLDADAAIVLPRVTVLRASAGSGKTYALTERYVQFLLSGRIAKNDLRNILAITFSQNASRQMRSKALEWLKMLSFRDPGRLSEMTALVEGGEDRVARRAEEMIGEILDRYSDFQVRTIDSFMSAVFRAAALDFGFSAEFEILLDAELLIDYAWSLFLRGAREGSARGALLDRVVRSVLGFKGSDAKYPWDPAPTLRAEIGALESRLAGLDEQPVFRDLDPQMLALENRIVDAMRALARMVEASGLERHGNSAYDGVRTSVQAGRFRDLVGGARANPPLNKPRGKDPAAHERYEMVVAAWRELGQIIDAYEGCFARAYYQPYLLLQTEMASTLERVKRTQARVFIGDIGRTLGTYLSADIVPDIYFRIGERVWHFLVDEFQDTSPLQWRNLFPLVENSLAMGGSLFVVGDTKQAIYGFRQADYTIMRSLEAASPFPSAPRDVRELAANWRSRPRLLALVASVFRGQAASQPKYSEAAARSGLLDWAQEARPGESPGYAEVEILERDDEDPPERRKLLDLMEDLRGRGWRWSDVAVLASRNDHIIRATSWLNQAAIPFISWSSLDVRCRKIAGELLALLAFLDSPPDDLSFATFLLGDIFSRTLRERHGWPDTKPLHDLLFLARSEPPLYKRFQREYPDLWKRLFAGLFRSTGYLPLYDLVCEAFAAFDLFSLFGEEEATLAKLLETVKEFEGTGRNSLRRFLQAAGSEADAWAIEVPRDAPSVKAMTIHKAKGLGFPVVVVLLYGEQSHGLPPALLREDGRLGLVRLTGDSSKRDPALHALYAEESTKQLVDRLNALYVALTRGEQELYVIGVKSKRDSFPFDLMPVDEFAPDPQARTRRLGAASGAAPLEMPQARLSHSGRRVAVAFAAGRMSREERRRGELIHRVLELAGGADSGGGGGVVAAALAPAAARAAREAREPGPDPAVMAALARLLADPALAGLCAPAPGRTVLVEQEFCDAQGRLFRMDRVVVDPGAVTVIDFKTGAEEPEAHAEQLRGYARILAAVYPGLEVRAVAAYVDLGVVRSIA